MCRAYPDQDEIESKGSPVTLLKRFQVSWLLECPKFKNHGIKVMIIS